MKKFVKLFFIFVIILGLVYIFYLCYQKWFDSQSVKKTFEAYKNQGIDFVKDKEEKFFSQVSDLAKKNTKKLTALVGEKIINLGESLKEDDLSLNTSSINMPVYLYKSTSDTFEAGETSSPNVVIDNSFNYNFISFLVRLNEDFKFLLNNSLDYKVDWGDGMVSSGRSKQNETTIVSHKWNKEGYYIVKMELVDVNQGPASKSSYSFSIRVLK